MPIKYKALCSTLYEVRVYNTQKCKFITEDAPNNPRNCIIYTKSQYWSLLWNLDALVIAWS